MSAPIDDQRQVLVDMVIPQPDMTGPEASAEAGIEHEMAETIWRALGMPHVDPEVRAFSSWDVEVLKHVRIIMDLGYPMDDLITVARLMGRAMSRITDAHSRVIREALVEPVLRSATNTDEVKDRIQPVIQMLLSITTPILSYTYRRHLASAIQQMSATDPSELSQPLAAGFVDLVAFSRISDDLEEAELGQLLSRFEELAMGECVDAGVRLVKIVGDSAMFVAPGADAALRAAKAIIDAVESDPGLPRARAGLDFGPVLARGGDYFGRPVNVASRITAFAKPGSLVISRSFLEAVDSDLPVTRITPRRLKNVGRVSLFRVDFEVQKRRKKGK